MLRDPSRGFAGFYEEAVESVEMGSSLVFYPNEA